MSTALLPTLISSLGLCIAPATSQQQIENEPDIVDLEVETPDEGEKQLDASYSYSSITSNKARDQGATTILDALSLLPSVVGMQGNAGLGSTDFKLNVAARGVDPRFSQRTAILLDDVPLAAAPYGRPHFELVPIPFAFIERIEVIPSGVNAEVGPNSLGGIVRIYSEDIADKPVAKFSATADQWGRFSIGAAYSQKIGRTGIALHYSPRFGTGERQNDDFQTHGAYLRVLSQLKHGHSIEATASGYIEDGELPGGLTPAAFDDNPRQSQRTHDSFSGYRVGGSLRWKYRPNWRRQASFLVFGGLTDRVSNLANEPDPEGTKWRKQPRDFAHIAAEPRIEIRSGTLRRVSHGLVAGARATFENSHLRSVDDPFDRIMPENVRSSDEISIFGAAAYLRYELHAFDDRLKLRVGGRFESAFASARDKLAPAGDPSMPRKDTTSQLDGLPDVAASWRFHANWSIFASYGHTFGPPHFLQLVLADSERNYRAERGRSAEAGLKFQRFSGIYLTTTAWYKRINDYADVSLDSFIQPGDTRAIGADADFFWNVGETWRKLAGLEFQSAYTYADGTVVGGSYDKKTVPWYGKHRTRSRISYRHQWGWLAGASLQSNSSYYTDYDNTKFADETGGIGKVPAFAVVDAFVGIERDVAEAFDVAFNLALRNATNTHWYSRTSDRNKGVIPLLPRTIFASILVRYKTK